jgi:hypothetical protein
MIRRISVKDYDKFEDFVFDAYKYMENSGEEDPIKIAEELVGKLHPNVQRMIIGNMFSFTGDKKDLLMQILYAHNAEEQIKDPMKTYKNDLLEINNSKSNNNQNRTFINRNRYQNSPNFNRNHNYSQNSTQTQAPQQYQRQHSSSQSFGCFHCGGRGHYQRDCFHKNLTPIEAQNARQQNFNNRSNNSQNSQNFSQSQQYFNNNSRQQQNQQQFNNSQHLNQNQQQFNNQFQQPQNTPQNRFSNQRNPQNNRNSVNTATTTIVNTSGEENTEPLNASGVSLGAETVPDLI